MIYLTDTSPTCQDLIVWRQGFMPQCTRVSPWFYVGMLCRQSGVFLFQFTTNGLFEYLMYNEWCLFNTLVWCWDPTAGW